MSRPMSDRSAVAPLGTGVPVPSAPAPALRATLALLRMELRLATRRGENLLVTIVIPSVLLLFFGAVPVLPTGTDRPIDFLLPGVLALAVVSTGLVNLGIATAYERHYGVLKRLEGAPLPIAAVPAAKLAAVAAIEVVQVALLGAIAGGVFGWSPGPTASPVVALAALVLGTICFASLGLAMAGSLRAEATLAGANALFLVLLLLGGVVLPLEGLPGPLESIGRVLPAAPLADLLRVGLGSAGAATAEGATESLAVLGAWSVGAAAFAVRAFRPR